MLTPCQSLCDSQKSLSRASNVFLKLFDVLFLQMQLVASLALLEKNLDSQFFFVVLFSFRRLSVVDIGGHPTMWRRSNGVV